MKETTKKLIKALEAGMVKEEGNICVNAEGVNYRYDHYKNKYKYTPIWLANIFRNAAEENGKKYERQFTDGNYSFYFNRAKYKGQKDGNITYSKLVIIK